MEGGLFLLLCLLALMIGSKAKRGRANSFTEKELRKKEKLKRIMVWTSLIVVTIFLLIYLPAMFQNIRIGIDTHFDKEIFLSIGLFIFGLFTVYSIVKSLMKSKP